MPGKKFITRRRFLAATAAAATAAAVPAGLSLRRQAAPVPQAPPLRVALFGCGPRGTEHLHALLQAGSTQANEHKGAVEIAAVFDTEAPRRNQAALLSGAPPFDDWRTVLDDEALDGVLIALPDALQAEAAFAAVEHGLAVFVDAPASFAPEALAHLVELAQQGGSAVHFNVPALAHIQWQAARELVASGRLGSLRWSQVNLGTLPVAAGPPAAEARSVAEPQHLHARLFEALAPMLYASGEAPEADFSAFGGSGAFTANLRFASGHTLVLANTHGLQYPMLRGSAASLELRGDRLRLSPEQGAPKDMPLSAEPLTPLTAWLDSIRGHARPACGPELAMATQLLTLQILSTREPVLA